MKKKNIILIRFRHDNYLVTYKSLSFILVTEVRLKGFSWKWYVNIFQNLTGGIVAGIQVVGSIT